MAGRTHVPPTATRTSPRPPDTGRQGSAAMHDSCARGFRCAQTRGLARPVLVSCFLVMDTRSARPRPCRDRVGCPRGERRSSTCSSRLTSSSSPRHHRNTPRRLPHSIRRETLTCRQRESEGRKDWSWTRQRKPGIRHRANPPRVTGNGAVDPPGVNHTTACVARRAAAAPATREGSGAGMSVVELHASSPWARIA